MLCENIRIVWISITNTWFFIKTYIFIHCLSFVSSSQVFVTTENQNSCAVLLKNRESFKQNVVKFNLSEFFSYSLNIHWIFMKKSTFLNACVCLIHIFISLAEIPDSKLFKYKVISLFFKPVKVVDYLKFSLKQFRLFDMNQKRDFHKMKSISLFSWAVKILQATELVNLPWFYPGRRDPWSF